jgi:hypothetical protein
MSGQQLFGVCAGSTETKRLKLISGISSSQKYLAECEILRIANQSNSSVAEIRDH